ncbi:LPS export ABC transporter periplasmic protein LptC [Rhodopseudomonas sp. P2A-2r]|uniref:LPS export ABC transporter periplasmic protein LptC n=1 Tax=unclassified Rhodopseudomonas TaxID=2638247 RepID=UPI0022349597|nr:LPS export ABC transporter periplasmic protein LptC [Rhodopseudomonas sp. P2A-2r]UZE49454.1 LPS export ABC transporter periplasmic protein LptC [Rhodopseudomonas sp. P2A-2r]
MSSVQIPSYQAGMDVRFAAAARHSRLVRVLRIAVPGVVLLAMAAIVGVSVFNPFRILANLPIDMGNLVVSGTKITMETPHLSGFSPDGRPYELWAKAATQDLTDPDHVELTTLRAKVMMEDKSTTTMDARSGIFNSKTQILELQKDVFLQSSTGYEARMTHAVIDIGKGTVASDEQVDVKLLNGTLVGQRLRIVDHGEVVRFEGGVVMNLVMDPPTPPESEPAKPAPELAPQPESYTQPAKARPSKDKRANAK